jgi:hypothetical protein
MHLPSDEPKDYEVGHRKPPAAGRFKESNRANPRGRPHGSPSIATLLERALDAPAVSADGKRRRLTKRELMIRGLVERSAGADLAATKLLLEMMRKADPRALAPGSDQAGPLGRDALALLKERLSRLAGSVTAPTPESGPSRANPSDLANPTNPPARDETE